MWFKRIFSKGEKQQNPSTKERQSANMEEDPEVKESKIYTVEQSEIDLRYSKLKIINNHSLHLPKNQIQIIQSTFYEDQEYLQGKPKYASEWVPIKIIVTDKQILVSPDLFRNTNRSIRETNYTHVPYGMLEKIQYFENKKQPAKLQLTLKDTRTFLIQSILADHLREIQKIVREFGFPNGINKFYAFKYGKICKQINGWRLYDFQTEMARQGVDKYLTNPGQGQRTQGKKVYQMIDNAAFEMSPTYPAKLIVPAGLSQKQVIRCSKFRTKERLPMLTYFYEYDPGSFVSLFRCSQIKGGLLANRCPEDEKMLLCIDASSQRISKRIFSDNKNRINCKIYDARGFYAAWGNRLAGKGFQNQQFYNCQLQFLDIPNIHAVRDSYNRVRGYNPSKQDFITALAQSGWIDYLFLILAGAKSMVKTMLSGKNVIVHCSDGWDRTTQLACLTQILIDPYYRTIQGFIVLFEKDWRSGGHKFRQRSGQYNHIEYRAKQTSPIFIQYLDCILQIMSQFPLSFEFNINFINFLAEAYQSYTYGTFLTNNAKETLSIQLEEKTVSVWSEILQEKEKYTNVLYRTDGPKILDIQASGIEFTIWKEHFLEEKTLQTLKYQDLERQLIINRQMEELVRKNQQEIENLMKKLAEQGKIPVPGPV